MPESALVIEPRLHDLGDGFVVRRLLPFRLRRRVGPFVFFDHFGPVELAPGRGMDVRPHPHIGLSTLTYLYEGAIAHRDSLDSDQVIRPGDVNWMTAGRGIVHSERTPAPERAAGHRLHGVQTWLALPLDREDIAPSFRHHDARALPETEQGGVSLRIVAGTAFGFESPVEVQSPTLYVDARLVPGSSVEIPTEHAERAVYAIDDGLAIDGVEVAQFSMHVLEPGARVRLSAAAGARALICGGAPLDGERLLWWNFVASSRERIEDAKRRWIDQAFGKVPGDDEFIPLPEDTPPPASRSPL